MSRCLCLMSLHAFDGSWSVSLRSLFTCCLYIPAFDLPVDGVIRKSPERGRISPKSITKTVKLWFKNIWVFVCEHHRQRKSGPAGLPETVAEWNTEERGNHQGPASNWSGNSIQVVSFYQREYLIPELAKKKKGFNLKCSQLYDFCSF